MLGEMHCEAYDLISAWSNTDGGMGCFLVSVFYQVEHKMLKSPDGPDGTCRPGLRSQPFNLFYTNPASSLFSTPPRQWKTSHDLRSSRNLRADPASFTPKVILSETYEKN